MTHWHTIVVVDWSGGNDRGARPVRDAIWVGAVADGTAETPVYLRNRQVAEDWLFDRLSQEAARGRRVLAGFDFPFGFPEGFAARLTGAQDALALWDWFDAHLTDRPEGNDRFALAARINMLFPGTGPFWFNGSRRALPDLPARGRDRRDFGLPEKRRAETAAPGAFSPWQLGGAGAVGSQAITGMAALARLRRRLGEAVRVWPFQPLDAPLAMVEVWPSLVRDAVAAAQAPGEIRDAVQVRLLAQALWHMQAQRELAPALDAAPAEARVEEGWIVGLGAEVALRRAAAEAAAPALTPPRLRDDCFAMPQGVAWIPVEDALDRLRAALVPVGDLETVTTRDAAGRVLAAPADARRANPPAANSAVDGYGFAHASTGAGIQRLPLVEGRAAAGQPFGGTVPAGSAVRILTGAILPEGVDTVVLEEDCGLSAGCVVFDGPVKPCANTRRAGEDLQAGAAALPAGHRLRAPDLALLSAIGVAQVTVRRRLRVAVLSTGDEIVGDPAGPAARHQIYDANRPMLLSLAAGWGHVTVDLGHVADRPQAIRAALDRGARDADVVLTSGGASAGDEDHVARLLAAEGRLSSWRIAMKPGRPLALALWHGVPVFGLPGNPVAALVCALIFARPALSLLAGSGWAEPFAVTVPAAFAKEKKAGRREFLRARLGEDGRAEVFGSEGSGRISGLSWATGLVELPDAAGKIAPGDPVRFLPYAGFGIL